MMCSNSDWAVIIPIFPRIGKFQLREVGFEIVGGAGDINNSISAPNYCNGAYIRLLPCANKVFSVWTEVWTGTCRSSRRFWLPEVVLGRFSRFCDSGRG